MNGISSKLNWGQRFPNTIAAVIAIGICIAFTTIMNHFGEELAEHEITASANDLGMIVMPFVVFGLCAFHFAQCIVAPALAFHFDRRSTRTSRDGDSTDLTISTKPSWRFQAALLAPYICICCLIAPITTGPEVTRCLVLAIPSPVATIVPQLNSELNQVLVYELGRRYYDRRTIEALLNKGADINAQDRRGTVLMRAAAAGDLEFARELIAMGAGINRTDCYGRTALVYALERLDSMPKASASKKEIALELIAHGADVRDIGESTNPLNVAVRYSNDQNLINVLLDSGAPIDGDKRVRGHITTFKTPLMTAASLGKPELVALLLARGADIDTATKDGYTALMYALVEGHAGCARLLITSGADVNHRSADGGTPLICATRHLPSFVEELSKAGAAGMSLQPTRRDQVPWPWWDHL